MTNGLYIGVATCPRSGEMHIATVERIGGDVTLRGIYCLNGPTPQEQALLIKTDDALPVLGILVDDDAVGEQLAAKIEDVRSIDLSTGRRHLVLNSVKEWLERQILREASDRKLQFEIFQASATNPKPRPWSVVLAMHAMADDVATIEPPKRPLLFQFS